MSDFESAVIAGVTAHMNGDHADDNLLIARAFGHPEALSSEMTGLDADAGIWRVRDARGEHRLRVPWPSGAIAERPEIRREVVLLYRAACERLGLEPRGEHPQEAPPRAHAGAGDRPFSVVIRESSWGDHSDSEGATFMEDIMRGRGTLGDYAALVAQHFFMYEALEEAADALADDPRFAAFDDPALRRLPALETDLAELVGERWRELISPVPATEAYAARIREVAAEGWVPGVIAHHYTRYLGDLSGGQMIARRVARQHGFDGAGIAFYDFASLGDAGDFKTRYRAGLDDLGAALDERERERMVAEVREAYRFNTEVFVDLAKAQRAA